MAKNKKDPNFIVDGVEYNPYSVDKVAKIPKIIKVLFTKFWFAGAVYFFIGWGLELASRDQFDVVLVLGIALGLVTDLFVNKILVFMEENTQSLHKYMMFCSKKVYSLFINIAYGLLLSIVLAYTYHLINLALIAILNKPSNSVPLPAEPILYGLFFLGFDMLFLTIKNLIKKLINKKENKGEINEVISPDQPK